jgi:hypothetical protein
VGRADQGLLEVPQQRTLAAAEAVQAEITLHTLPEGPAALEKLSFVT